MTRKIVSEMTYNVSMGTLNPTIPYHTIPSFAAIYEVVTRQFTLCLVFLPYNVISSGGFVLGLGLGTHGLVKNTACRQM